MVFIFGVLGWFPDSRPALIVGAVWIGLLVLAYLIWVKPVADQAAQLAEEPSLSHR